jgi:hypothetical protein
MIKSINIAFVACLISFSLSAQIYEITSIKEVLHYLDATKKQIVVFDIDNTLLCPAQDLGSDQWISNLIKEKTSTGLTNQEAWEQMLSLYCHIQKFTTLMPTEDNLINSIHQIETACNHTICLTARSLCLADLTLKQIFNNNLFFQVPEIDHTRLNLPDDSIYQDGVLFCGNNCKGLVLIKFLEVCHYKTTTIIFVDDKLYNLQAVQKQLANTNIQFIGLRYAGCDARIARFDAQQTNQDLVQFLKLHPLTN